MAKLRKMLGNIEDPSIVSLMRIMETQSKVTLAHWAITYAEKNILSIYESIYNGDLRLRDAISSSKEYLDGAKKLWEVKPILKDLRDIAKDIKDNPIGEAAARAVSTACATIQTPTNALGFTFYAVAATVYNQVGLCEKQEVYDELAKIEFTKILESFNEVAIEGEENPAKINWNC